MSGRSSPPFVGLAPLPDAWDVVVKVKYGDTLKRFNGYINGTHFDLNLSALRSKIVGAFKLGPDADFILTYTDEDGDVVMLDDDDDLRDAAINQKLNPLRINVQLKSSHTDAESSNSAPQRSTTHEDPLVQIKSVIDEALKLISKPLRSTARADPLAQLKSAIDEAMKSIHEPVPDALAKLLHEVLDAAPPQLSELIKPFVKSSTSGNNSPSDGHADGSFGSSSGVVKPHIDLKTSDVEARSGSQPSDAQSYEPSETRGVKSVLFDAQYYEPSETRGVKSVLAGAPGSSSAKSSQGQQASFYPSIDGLLFSTNSGGTSDAQTKGKSPMPLAAPSAPPVAPIFRPTPPTPPIGEWSKPRTCETKYNPSTWHSEANAKANSDFRWRIPLYRAPHPVPCPLGSGPSPRFPYPSRLLSSGHLYGDHGNSWESALPPTSHRWIQCDGCGVQPIVGPRYKSNVKEDYDLCDLCFHRMGNGVEYTRIDKPILPHKLSRDMHRKINGRAVMKSKKEKLESRFILDVTVLDGTLMSPSTPFTKIWRMHNNGSIMWPLGTQLIWVGGDQFALNTSVPLEIPVNGFPVDQEIDVAVDFVAPARPGRYISYWRLASPSGQKFGQRVWVHIQVEDPSFVNDNRNAAINLNLPPESNGTNTTNLIDVNIEPVDQVFGERVRSTKVELLEPLIYHEVGEPKKSSPVSAAAPPHPIIDVPSSSASVAGFVPNADVSASEPVNSVPPPVDVPTSVITSIPVNVPASASPPTPVDAAASEPHIDNLTEAKLLQELEEMGFRQVDLNKEILRQNKYNLEQSVDDLCGVNEWDPLLAELHEMGFDDTETNKELLARNGGSIKRAVMDLIAREKKYN